MPFIRKEKDFKPIKASDLTTENTVMLRIAENKYVDCAIGFIDRNEKQTSIVLTRQGNIHLFSFKNDANIYVLKTFEERNKNYKQEI